MEYADFRVHVYAILRTVPRGTVVTYGQLAALAGRPTAARAIGALMRTNPDAPHTPCHRVVAADGSLHGYSGEGGVGGKKKMLRAEGVQFIGEKVDMQQCQWKTAAHSVIIQRE